MSNDRLQDAFEEWAQEWKPKAKGQHHPSCWEGFEAGWMAAIEIMLERLEHSKI